MAYLNKAQKCANKPGGDVFYDDFRNLGVHKTVFVFWIEIRTVLFEDMPPVSAS